MKFLRRVSCCFLSGLIPVPRIPDFIRLSNRARPGVAEAITRAEVY